MEDAITTRIGDNGRFVIPSEIRKQLKLRDGDRVQVGIQDGKIVIYTAEALLAEFYGLTRNVRSADVDVVQELIDERRQEAASE